MIGFLNVNKKSGISSAFVVNKVKKLLPKGTKVGHMGTLDPIASGVLPIAIGRATRLFDLMQNKTKEYIATFKFGLSTNTFDSTGETAGTTNIIPTKQDILSALPSFVGKISQLPPSFSAKMVNGVRAYQKARKGENVELKECEIFIESFELIEELDDNTFKFRIVCGSGTYIRSLCRDLANKLNTLAVMTELVRTRSGQFCLENAQDCDKIDINKLLKVEDIFNFAKVDLNLEQLKTLLDGKKLNLIVKDATYFGFCENQLQLIFSVMNGSVCNKIWLR